VSRCIGCGAIIQSNNPEQLGYVAEAILIERGKDVYCKTPNMLIAAAFYEANGYTLESFDEDIITYMKLLRDIQPETDFIKGLFGWLGFEKKQMLMDYIIMSDNK